MATHETYLGNKGYTIYKKTLSSKEQQLIKETLVAKPYLPGSPANNQDGYPVYLESPNKFYIPRFFGIAHFGPPKSIKITSGVKIDINFKGDVRDYQKDIIGKFFETIKHTPGGLLDIPCGFGKTIMALKIISQLGLKTLVIVHKGFLLDQWIEKIEEFLPAAKIGRIQGQTIDIEGKDIVIGMLQSLSMKDYPEGTFDEFGFTIIDETHHIGAEVFIRAVQKIITPYILGLSATMERKDGLTKFFKMFIGEVIYKMKRDKEDNVLVKAIEFTTSDEEFNTVEYDFRGNVKYSTMISKLCSFNARSELILHVIKNELLLNNNQQIIVLAHNKNLLTYLYKAIEHRTIATVGYYVGGMKQAALKESENKQVIIATYSMAAEGLDIKSLTTVILATPKTDIEQSVGRILRIKHEQPLIIDIVDGHDSFKKQWDKRKTYYLKNNYKVIYTKDYQKGEWTPIIKNAGKKSLEKKCLITI